MGSPLDDRKSRLLEKLSALPGTADLLLKLADSVPAEDLLDQENRTDDQLVPGCTARLWLARRFEAGRCHFACASDSRIVEAVASLLCGFYTGAEPEDILRHPPGFLKDAGLTAHLTANRRNALSNVWKIIRSFAEAHVEGERSSR